MPQTARHDAAFTAPCDGLTAAATGVLLGECRCALSKLTAAIASWGALASGAPRSHNFFTAKVVTTAEAEDRAPLIQLRRGYATTRPL